MLIGVAAILFLVGLAGAFFSFGIVGKKKKTNRKTGAAVAGSIAFCLLAILAAFYLASALLLLGSID